jgi:hypothetical protein
MSTSKVWIGQKGMRWAFWALTLLLVLTIALCWIFYIGNYTFFGQTISSLGHTTDIVFPFNKNTISQWIFTGGFILMAIGAVVMIVGYFTPKTFYGAGFKIFFLFMLVFGAIGTAFPADIGGVIGTIHIIGAGLFVSGFGLFNFSAQSLRYIRKHMIKPTSGRRKFDYYLDLTFVILTFIAVAWYLLSGLFIDILGNPGPWFGPLNTPFSQKILLIIGVISAFLLDKDDM